MERELILPADPVAPQSWGQWLLALPAMAILLAVLRWFVRVESRDIVNEHDDNEDAHQTNARTLALEKRAATHELALATLNTQLATSNIILARIDQGIQHLQSRRADDL